MDCVVVPADDIVSRTIEGELIIISIANGAGDLEDELCTLNQSGQIIWQPLDGRQSLSTSGSPWTYGSKISLDVTP